MSTATATESCPRRSIFSRIASFYAISPDSAERDFPDEQARTRFYKKLRLQAFFAATIGYSLYYVCRTSLNVMKKPIIDSGALDATQLGIISSALLFAYAIGKFVNGFIADYCNIKRFMATGLIISALANAFMGIMGLTSAAIPATVMCICFAIMWCFNGWAQSMGAPPAIISLSRWFPLKERGTYYGFFSASHNLGEFFSFLFVGSIVNIAGWQSGFFGSAIAGAIGIALVLFFLHDHPRAHGLPSIEALSGEKTGKADKMSTRDIQKMVLRTPAVWVLAAASAFMYISRYAINGWGMLFLQEQKGFTDVEALSIISINALLGIAGTVLSGWFSDQLFKGDRLGACSVPIRGKCPLGQHPRHGALRHRNRRADLLPRRPDGCRHCTPARYRRRPRSGRHSLVCRRRHTGCCLRLAHQRQYHRCRRCKPLQFPARCDILARSIDNLIPAASAQHTPPCIA